MNPHSMLPGMQWLVLFALGLSLLSPLLSAAPGDLDPSFGSGGVVRTLFPGSSVEEKGTDLALQADGKIVVGLIANGKPALSRILPDGGIDRTFGYGGKVVPITASTWDCSVAVQADGKIVVAAGAENFVVLRVDAWGRLDPGFGDGGMATIDFGGTVEAPLAVALQADGRIVVAGQTGADMGVARLLTDGTLDPSFGSGGKVVTDVSQGSWEQARDLVIQPDGKIVAVGSTQLGGQIDIAVVRYLADGALDPGFGGDGTATIDAGFGRNDDGRAAAILPDGRIVVAGALGGLDGGFVCAVFRPDGTPDPAFGGGDGCSGGNFAGYSTNEGWDLIVSAGGEFLVAGYIGDETGARKAALFAFVPDGSFGPAFSYTPGDASHHEVYAALLQPDGRMVLAGKSDARDTADVLLMGLVADRSLDAGFYDGAGGMWSPHDSGEEELCDLAVQADGKLVAAGWATYAGIPWVLVERLLPSGHRDTEEFNGGWREGYAAVHFQGDTGSKAHAAVVQPDGAIVAAGVSYSGSNSSPALLRLQSNGALDTQFGNGGGYLFPGGSGTHALHGLALLADGRILAVGESQGDAVAVRVSVSGQPDSDFNGSGQVHIDFGGSSDVLHAVALQDDGKFVAAGSSDGDVVVARCLASGQLDTGFGNGGWVVLDLGSPGDRARAIGILSDQRLLVAGEAGGDLFVARLTPAGSLESEFAQGGVAVLDLGAADDSARDLLGLEDGSILVGGASGGDLVVLRCLPGGGLDADFGEAGVYRIGASHNLPFAGGALAHGESGRILVAGRVEADETRGTDFCYYRLNPDGSLNRGFWPDGSPAAVVFDFPVPITGSPAGVVLPPGGGIAVAGTTAPGNEVYDIALAQYLTDGSLDPGFGPGGVTVADLGSNSTASDIAVQPDGKRIVVGSAGDSENHDALMVRYLPDGSLDSSFGTGGSLRVDLGGQWDAFSDVVIDSGGRIVVTAGVGAGITVRRFLGDGTPDSSFGTDGAASTAIPSRFLGAKALCIQPDGRILVAGGIREDATNLRDFLVIRYLENGSLDEGFGAGGIVITDAGNVTDSIEDIALQGDGKIVAAANSVPASGQSDGKFVVARYLANGQLDGGFGSQGIIRTTVGGIYSATVCVRIDSANRIVVGGSYYDYSWTPPAPPVTVMDYAIVRYLPDGSLDPGFGAGGIALADTCPGLEPDADWLVDLAIPLDGKIVALGRSEDTKAGLQALTLIRFQDGRPAVTTPTSTGITGTGAILGGNVTGDGGEAITERGVVYAVTGTNGDPVIGGAGVTRVSGSGTTGVFTVPVNGLVPATLYSFRAYAINAAGTAYSAVATFTTGAPEIAVQQPAGTDLADGESRDFGEVVVGESASLSFVIGNVGTGELTGLTITKDGSHAPDFTLAAEPVAPVAPGGSTTFTVQFAPSATGLRTAVLHIASNDADENPFDVVLTGTGVTPLQAFQCWADSCGLSGPDAGPQAEPCGDGVCNLLKYACNMNATGPDVRVLVPDTGMAGLPSIVLGAGGPTGTLLRIEFLQRKNSGLSYTPQKSTSLTSWGSLSAPPEVFPTGDPDWERVICEEPVDLATTKRGFGRVLVEMQ